MAGIERPFRSIVVNQFNLTFNISFNYELPGIAHMGHIFRI